MRVMCVPSLAQWVQLHAKATMSAALARPSLPPSFYLSSMQQCLEKACSKESITTSIQARCLGLKRDILFFLKPPSRCDFSWLFP